MTRCPKSPKKKRVSPTGKGNPGDYKHGMRGHTWTKIILNDITIGRQCECGKTVYKPIFLRTPNFRYPMKVLI